MSKRGPVVEVQGLKTLRRDLKAAGAELTDLKAAHAAVAQTVVRAAHFTPKHPARSTGALAASVRGSGQAGAAVVRAGRAALPYTNAIHWGHRARHIVAQPFVYDAIVATRDEWTGQYLHELNKIIDNVRGAPGP